MQTGGHRDERDVLGSQRVLIGQAHELRQDHLGHGLHIQHVHAAFAVAELHDVRQDVHHEVVGLLALVHLVGHHAHERALLLVQHERVHDAAADDVHVVGAVDEVGHAQLVGAFDIGGVGLGGHHDDRDVLDPAIFVHDLQHVEAVHLRHDIVEQHERYARALFLQRRHGLLAVLRLDDAVGVADHVGKQCAIQHRVINDEDRLLLTQARNDGSRPLSNAARLVAAVEDALGLLFGTRQLA